jgi:hypothetical protein
MEERMPAKGFLNLEQKERLQSLGRVCEPSLKGNQINFFEEV